MSEALAKTIYIVPMLLAGSGPSFTGPSQMFAYGVTQDELQNRLNHVASHFIGINVLSEKGSGYTPVVLNKSFIIMLHKEMDLVEIEKGSEVGGTAVQKLPPVSKEMN